MDSKHRIATASILAGMLLPLAAPPMIFAQTTRAIVPITATLISTTTQTMQREFTASRPSILPGEAAGMQREITAMNKVMQSEFQLYTKDTVPASKEAHRKKVQAIINIEPVLMRLKAKVGVMRKARAYLKKRQTVADGRMRTGTTPAPAADRDTLNRAIAEQQKAEVLEAKVIPILQTVTPTSYGADPAKAIGMVREAVGYAQEIKTDLDNAISIYANLPLTY